MRFFRRPRESCPEPDMAELDSARALAESRERLERDTEQVIAPHYRLRERNNVTQLVRSLIRNGGESGGHSAASG